MPHSLSYVLPHMQVLSHYVRRMCKFFDKGVMRHGYQLTSVQRAGVKARPGVAAGCHGPTHQPRARCIVTREGVHSDYDSLKSKEYRF